MITNLIHKKDHFEIIRDQVAAILATEISHQKYLAGLANEDIDLWDVRVYRERANPWEEYLNDILDVVPLVNVWYDSSTFKMTSSDVVERQNCEAVYNLDCYAVGNATDDGAGHAPGDLASAVALHRVIRLIRNIVMAGEYTYLGLRGIVWQRWVHGISVFQPHGDRLNVRPVIGARLPLKVCFCEFSPQVACENLDYIGATVQFKNDGEVIVRADFQF